MLFTDTSFLFYFLPITLILHRFTTSFRKSGEYNDLSRFTLFGLTLVFYGWHEPWWLVPFTISIVFDFLWASLLVRETRPALRKLYCLMSVTQNLGLLGIFKYRDFLVSNLAHFSPSLAAWVPAFQLSGHPLPLPPGISFYTFESLSFVIDVYRREVMPPKRPQEFFAFIGMFPRFIAGPIVRYKDMVSQFSRYRGMQIEPGLFLFSLGLFLKCIFADSFALFAETAFAEPARSGFLWTWIGVIAYSMQIYFDFSGYSLMAIGLGRCLGFQFPANFRQPYLATSLQDFWRRWHISLSTWLRDYLYISLGGSKRGTWRTYLNIFITMLLGGIWHGAKWSFVVWGAWHGFCLCFERAVLSRLPVARAVGRGITLLMVLIGWVFFRSRGPTEGFVIIKHMFNPFSRTLAVNPDFLHFHPVTAALCVTGLVYCFFWESKLDPGKLEGLFETSWPQRLAACGMFVLSISWALSNSLIPFLYFQF